MWVEDVMRTPSSILGRHSDFTCCNSALRYGCHVIIQLQHSLVSQSQPTITQSVCCVSLFLNVTSTLDHVLTTSLPRSKNSRTWRGRGQTETMSDF